MTKLEEALELFEQLTEDEQIAFLEFLRKLAGESEARA